MPLPLVGIGIATVGVPLIGGQLLSWWTGRQNDFKKIELYRQSVQAGRETNLKRGAKAARKTAEAGREAVDQEIALFQGGKFLKTITPSEAYPGAKSNQAQRAGDIVKLSGGPAAFAPPMGAGPATTQPAMDPRMAKIAPVAQQISGQYGTREFANAMWDHNASARPYANSWATLAGYPDDFTKGIG